MCIQSVSKHLAAAAADVSKSTNNSNEVGRLNNSLNFNTSTSRQRRRRQEQADSQRRRLKKNDDDAKFLKWLSEID
jgi:hypothetical protein